MEVNYREARCINRESAPRRAMIAGRGELAADNRDFSGEQSPAMRSARRINRGVGGFRSAIGRVASRLDGKSKGTQGRMLTLIAADIQRSGKPLLSFCLEPSAAPPMLPTGAYHHPLSEESIREMREG